MIGCFSKVKYWWPYVDYNIMIGDVNSYDTSLFEGPIVVCDNDNIRFPQLLSKLGIFKSVSDAKRNGWDKDIPEGYNEYKIGKHPISYIYILKVTNFSDCKICSKKTYQGIGDTCICDDCYDSKPMLAKLWTLYDKILNRKKK